MKLSQILAALVLAMSAAVAQAEVTGTVTAVYVTEWVPVRKGDRLARLDTTETEAGIAALKAMEAQARVGNHIARDELRAGDLVFFGSGSNVNHVGIYADDGEFIHASTRARSVRFDRLDNKYFRNRYIGARRVL